MKHTLPQGLIFVLASLTHGGTWPRVVQTPGLRWFVLTESSHVNAPGNADARRCHGAQRGVRETSWGRLPAP